WPHDVDRIFDLTLGAAPHVLVAVRRLHRGAGRDLDRLGDIALIPVAPGTERLLNNAEDKLVLDERGSVARSFEQRSEAAGTAAIEWADRRRCRGEGRRQVARKCRDGAFRDCVRDDAE